MQAAMLSWLLEAHSSPAPMPRFLSLPRVEAQLFMGLFPGAPTDSSSQDVERGYLLHESP